MNLLLQRNAVTPGATFGVLYLGEDELCVTLENPPAEDKGAIPAGVYPIHLWYSPKFSMLLPRLEEVPGFTDILIHPGNTARDTLGCILTGVYRVDARSVADSRMALGRVLTRWREWHEGYVEVRNP